MNVVLKKKYKGIQVVLLALILILVLAALILLYKVAEQKEYNKQLSLGEKYFAELDYENAELCFQKAIEINERKLNPYISLCNTYIVQGNYTRAYEVVHQIEVVNVKYYKGRNQDIVDSLTKTIDELVEPADGEGGRHDGESEGFIKPEEGQTEQIDPIDSYSDILEEYRRVAESNFSEDILEQTSYVNEGVWNFRNQDKYSVYYRLADLSGDQSQELLISINEKEAPHSILDIYGIEDGVPVRIIESNTSVGYRSIYNITIDNRIKNEGSGGALFSQINYYRIPADSVSLELDEQYTYNGEQGDVYTHISSDNVSTSITEQDYMQVVFGEDVDYESEWELLYEGNSVHYIE